MMARLDAERVAEWLRQGAEQLQAAAAATAAGGEGGGGSDPPPLPQQARARQSAVFLLACVVHLCVDLCHSVPRCAVLRGAPSALKCSNQAPECQWLQWLQWPSSTPAVLTRAHFRTVGHYQLISDAIPFSCTRHCHALTPCSITQVAYFLTSCVALLPPCS